MFRNNYRKTFSLIRIIVLLLSLIFFSLYGGDVESDFIHQDDPHGELFDKNLLPEEIGVAVVFGGCSSRGLGYVGVLHVFEKYGIPIDVIIGASAGGIVGSIYADNPNAESVKEIFLGLTSEDMYDDSCYLWNQRYGYANGSQLRKTLQRLLTVENFEDLKIPFIVTATDLMTGELMSYNKGNIACALQASSACPPFFSPMEYNGHTLIDAAVAHPMPTYIAKDLGAKLVIAVDFSLPMSSSQPSNIAEVIRSCYDIAYLSLIRCEAKIADVYIRLTLPQEMGEQIHFADNPFLDETYDAGVKAAERALPKLLKLLKEKGIM